MAKRDAEGNIKQLRRRPVETDVCHICKRSGHWARECPQNKVGLQSASVLNEQENVCCDVGTVNAVRGAPVLTGANAVPIPSAKAQQIAERVKAQRRGIRVSFGHNAFACPIQPPLVAVGMNALSKDGLTMLFFAHVAEHQGGTGGQRQEAKVLVDSGATHCYVSEAFVRRHGFQKMEQVSTSLRLATGALVLKQLGSVLSR